MKKLNKRIQENRNNIRSSIRIAYVISIAIVIVGPGGYPWALAKESLRENMKSNIDRNITA